MTRYALLDNNSGLVWGIVDANTPADACRRVDEDFGEPGRTYMELLTRAGSTEGAYEVYEVPADFDVRDGATQEAIDAVMAHRHVATVRYDGGDDEAINAACEAHMADNTF